MIKTIEIKNAHLDDAATISSIIKEASDWLESTGNPMWNNNENNIENIVAEIGLYFIAFVNGEAGGIIKFQTEDDVFWPELKENNSAFIHRFAVRRKYSGGELSTEITHISY